LARLVQLGIRKAYYFGRVKTLFQLFLAATVANLTLVATKLGMMGKANRKAFSLLGLFHQHAVAIAKAFSVCLSSALLSIPLPDRVAQKPFVWTGGCRRDL
jgi:hypothetical protein